ncbi:MAG: HAMP domain-containing histidine kinase, partial [Alphaproteobacteria bacterium]|nr:HAMP domain-containing histidine kinase [Alphaproteobacteria bacterium]
VAGFEGVNLDEVITRFDILWARASLFINGGAFEVMRQQAGIGKVGADILEILQSIEDEVMALERGDLATLAALQAELQPFEARLAEATTRIADLEVEQRDVVASALRNGLAELDELGAKLGLVVFVVLSLFAVEAFQARRAEQKLAGYQGHLEDLVAKRTDELEKQTVRLEQALGKERELRELQRHFVSMVSHEFRTPLAIIDGSVQRLKRRIDQMSKDKIDSTLDQIVRSVRRLLHLMESTLSAAQLEAGSIATKLEACNIRALVEEVCNDQREICKGHQIILDATLLPDAIQADGELLRQVFTNLLSNAVKYSPEGRQVWMEGTTDDGQAVIAVRDQGVGIPEEELPNLFERFFRASTSTGIPGTGIGLNFVKHLVEIHGGSIDVATKAGKGSVFTVRLPIDGPSLVENQQAA